MRRTATILVIVLAKARTAVRRLPPVEVVLTLAVIALAYGALGVAVVRGDGDPADRHRPMVRTPNSQSRVLVEEPPRWVSGYPSGSKLDAAGVVSSISDIRIERVLPMTTTGLIAASSSPPAAPWREPPPPCYDVFPGPVRWKTIGSTSCS